MSGSDRGRLFAVVATSFGLFIAGCLIAAAYEIGASQAERRAYAERHADQYPADTQKRITECRANPDPLALEDCIAEVIKSSRESWRAEYDLQAQGDMAEWAFWLLAVSLAQLPIGIFGLMALLRTIWQGDEGLKHARVSAKTEQRAWVKFEIEASWGLKTNADGVRRFAFKGKLKNIGNTPALHVNYFPRLCFSDAEKALAADVEDAKRNPLPWAGTPILPGDDHLINFTANVEEPARQEAGTGHGGFSNGSLVFLVFLVQYRTVYDDTHHHTAGVFRVVMKSSFADAIDFDDGWIPEGDLVLKRFQEGIGYVD